MNFKCQNCGSGNTRSFDTSPLYHPTKEELAEGTANFDDELYVEFICDDCKETFTKCFRLIEDTTDQEKGLSLYKVFNNVEGEVIFEGTERAFITFAEKIVEENGDTNYSVLGSSDALEYITDYCSNLDVLD